MKEDQQSKALSYCYRLLAQRARSAYEIRYRLARKGYTETIIADCLANLAKHGYLDDLEFARQWVTERSRNKPCGEYRLTHELRKKGIDDNIIDEVLGEFRDSFIPERLCRQALERYCSTRSFKDIREKKRKAYAFLRRRGFSSSEIQRCIHNLDSEEFRS